MSAEKEPGSREHPKCCVAENGSLPSNLLLPDAVKAIGNVTVQEKRLWVSPNKIQVVSNFQDRGRKKKLFLNWF